MGGRTKSGAVLSDGTDFRIARAPGRVNLVGEHTDHVGGLVLPLSIDREIRVRFRPRADGLVVVRSAAHPAEEDRFDPADAPPREAGDWRNYPRGVASLLHAEGLVRRGLDAEVDGGLPEGAGLSSSAALEAAFALALLDVSGATLPRTRLAAICREAEHRWAGVDCGIMDQLAVLCGRRDAALRIDCASGEVRPATFGSRSPDLVAIPTGVRHALSATPYNERVREFRSAIEAPANRALPAPLDRRRRHVLTENERVDAAVVALAEGDLETLGRRIDESHASLRDDAEVSWPEAEETVERARAAGALGARMLGGGFGGSVLAAFPPGEGERFARRAGGIRLHPAPAASVETQSSP